LCEGGAEVTATIRVMSASLVYLLLHLAPLNVAARRMGEELLKRVAMVAVEVRCHRSWLLLV